MYPYRDQHKESPHRPAIKQKQIFLLSFTNTASHWVGQEGRFKKRIARVKQGRQRLEKESLPDREKGQTHGILHSS